MRRIAILLLLLPLNSGLPQEISPPTIQVISRLVVIDVLVRDKRTGARVDNLTATTFASLTRVVGRSLHSSGARATPARLR